MFRDVFPLVIAAASLELFVCFITANRAGARIFNRDQAVACGSPALLFGFRMHRRGIVCLCVFCGVMGRNKRVVWDCFSRGSGSSERFGDGK